MRRLSSRRLAGEAEVNPMDGLGNLADAMLVLAVGIMLALILNWKVDITALGVEAPPEPEETAQSQQLPLDEGDLSEAEDQALDESEMQRIGELYYDAETGTYYAVMED